MTGNEVLKLAVICFVVFGAAILITRYLFKRFPVPPEKVYSIRDKFPQVLNDEVVTPIMDDYVMKCCDCGLIHTFRFRAIRVTEHFPDETFSYEELDPKKYRVQLIGKRPEHQPPWPSAPRRGPGQPTCDNCPDVARVGRCKGGTCEAMPYGVAGMDEGRAKRVGEALRSMQEMWDHLRRKGLNEVLMREYSGALEVLEKDFTAQLPAGVRVGQRPDFEALVDAFGEAMLREGHASAVLEHDPSGDAAGDGYDAAISKSKAARAALLAACGVPPCDEAQPVKRSLAVRCTFCCDLGKCSHCGSPGVQGVDRG